MDLNENPTTVSESDLGLKDREILRCDDSGQFKKLSQDNGIICVAMDNEVQEKGNQLLQSKLSELEFQKAELEREVKALKERNEELVLHIASIEKSKDINNEDNKIVSERSRKSLTIDEKIESDDENFLLKIENNVLECEKQNAEREAETWKQKCKELELRLLVLQGRSSLEKEELHIVHDTNNDSRIASPSGHKPVAVDEGTHNGGICVKTPDKYVNFKHDIQVINLDGVGHSSRARKQLFYGDDETINEKTAPCTPAGARTPGTFTAVNHHQGKKDGMSDCNEKTPFVATPKRKRTVNIVTSDTESDDDDNIPISQLVRKKNQQLDPQPVVSNSDDDAEFPTRRSRRLVKLSQYNGGNKTMEIDESENDDNDDDDHHSMKIRRLVKLSQYNGGNKTTETDESENDDDSMENFIDSRSEVSESEEESSDAAQDSSDSDEDFDGILDRIKRTKHYGSKWEWEAEMLADFGKNDMLCMKAVCALYRQQTSDEQEVHETLVNNGRGFSKFDADRGSDLAEFLTDKVPNGDVIRTVEQLNEFDPNGLEKCRTLATRYSKQLFEIYKNEEDPHFFPT